MRQLTGFLVAIGLISIIGCTQPVPVKTTKSGAGTVPTTATTSVSSATKPADKSPEKPADKTPEKPADKTPEKPAGKPADKTPPPK